MSIGTRTYRTRSRLEAAIIVALAGESAERKYLGARARLPPYHSEADWQNAFNLALLGPGVDTEEAEAYLSWLAIRAKRLWWQPIDWAGVQGLAACLLTTPTIKAAAARRIVLEARRAWLDRAGLPRTIRFVATHGERGPASGET